MTTTTLSLTDALLVAGLFLATAMAFLLAGWRLGRESAGRPMFDHPLSAARDVAACGGEPDPWAEAMHGPVLPDPASADARRPAGS
jgi:hypothetical protein